MSENKNDNKERVSINKNPLRIIGSKVDIVCNFFFASELHKQHGKRNFCTCRKKKHQHIKISGKDRCSKSNFSNATAKKIKQTSTADKVKKIVTDSITG